MSSFVLLVSQLQDHVGFETISPWVVILRLDDSNFHDPRLGEISIPMSTSAGDTLPRCCENILAHTDAIGTDGLGGLTSTHVRGIDDTPIV